MRILEGSRRLVLAALVALMPAAGLAAEAGARGVGSWSVGAGAVRTLVRAATRPPAPGEAAALVPLAIAFSEPAGTCAAIRFGGGPVPPWQPGALRTAEWECLAEAALPAPAGEAGARLFALARGEARAVRAVRLKLSAPDEAEARRGADALVAALDRLLLADRRPELALLREAVRALRPFAQTVGGARIRLARERSDDGAARFNLTIDFANGSATENSG